MYLQKPAIFQVALSQCDVAGWFKLSMVYAKIRPLLDFPESNLPIHFTVYDKKCAHKLYVFQALSCHIVRILACPSLASR